MSGAGQTPRATQQVAHTPVPRQRQLKNGSTVLCPSNSLLSQVVDEDPEVYRSWRPRVTGAG